MESLNSRILITRTERWIAIVLCAAIIVPWTLEHLVQHNTAHTPIWLTPAASLFIVAGIINLHSSTQWYRIQRALLWTSLLLMVWTANGLLFDLFAMAGLIGDPKTGLKVVVNWLSMSSRMLAFAIVVVLARILLKLPRTPISNRSASWYGYAAFIFALPYPVLRIIWLLGGTIGLKADSAAGHGIAPWMLTIPWLLAAALSLLLISPQMWKPRRFLLIAGWSATAIVASIAPAACWSFVTKLGSGELTEQADMATWVFGLFYVSWFLWAITACAATRSYQLRSAGNMQISEDLIEVEEARV